jgi:hypothetical protein
MCCEAENRKARNTGNMAVMKMKMMMMMMMMMMMIYAI